jgi:hypothetical protein
LIQVLSQKDKYINQETLFLSELDLKNVKIDVKKKNHHFVDEDVSILKKKINSSLPNDSEKLNLILDFIKNLKSN